MKSSSLRMPIPIPIPIPMLCVGLLVLPACGREGEQQSPPQMPPPEVGVLSAEPTSAPLTKDFVGRLAPYRSADVRARVAGVLLERSYAEGTNVKKGQVLFQIDPAPLEATLDANRASQAQAEATHANNKAAAQRARELVSDGFLSKAALDEAAAAERIAAAAVQQARANVRSARINLGFATVTAPIGGRAGQQQVTEGALVGQGEATLLTTVEQLDPLYVNFTMSMADLGQLRAAQRKGNVTLADPNKASVQIVLRDGSTYGEGGILDFADASVNPATGALDLRAKIPNPRGRLLSGMYVTLKANLGEQNNVFLIPQPAVLGDTSGPYVMTVGEDGKVARKSVTIAGMSGGNFVVSGGLKAGDQVVVSGLQQVKEGAPAKAVPWQPANSGGQQPAQAPGTATPSGN